MADKPKIMCSFREDEAIVEYLKAKADQEGTTFNALVRRAIRKQYFSSPTVPTSETCPKTKAA